jgi:hypothetical protein
MPFSKEFWIEREDFMETPTKGYFRLFPGNTVRLRYGFVVKCIGCDKDAAGNITAVHCEYMPDSKSGTPGQDSYKVKGNIHWVSAAHAYAAEVRLYDRLFSVRRRAKAGAISSPTSTRIVEAGHHRATRTGALKMRRRRSLPVRTPRLFRRRPHRFKTRRTGVQPHRDLERLLACNNK